MRMFIFYILAILSSLSIHSQIIQNSGFESISKSSKKLPAFWSFMKSKSNGELSSTWTNQFVGNVDTNSYHSGKSALKISVTDSTSFVFGASQKIKINFSSAKKIRISTCIKTIDCKQGAAFNCTQFNSKGERISYTSSRQQETMVMDTRGWTKSEILVLLRPDVKSFELLLYVYGNGTAWFDDVKIESVSESKMKTAPIVTAYIDTVVKIVKEYSYFKDSIDWNIFPKQLVSLSTGKQTYREARLVVNYLLNELKLHGDNHSFLMSPADVKGFSVGDIMGRGRQVETEYLGEGIGYISMPGFASLSDSIRDAFASNAQQLIRKVDAENKICGWVVDLRYDDGGSASPMIAGMGPILGEGIYDMNISKNNDTSYGYYNNGSSYGFEKGKIIPESVSTVLKPYKLKNENVPVAVLIGPRCGSSGECAVAAFIGRKDTKLFGKPTAGFTKGNADFTLADGSMLFIASGVQTDRNGKKYPDRIFPDVQVDEAVDSKDDVTLERAKKWLVSFGICK